MPFQLIQRDLQVASSTNTDSGAVSFQQQGTVDWSALGSNSLHASVAILSRISAAGIDPFTIVMGQAVCGALVWGAEGRNRFDQALAKCRGLAGYRNVLWFGFGVKHVASVLTSTEQGATCAALCSCLAECYGSDMAAEIILETTIASKPTTETVPSLVQWRNLVDACAGLVANSTFGIRAEQLMRLAGDTRIAVEGRPGCDRGVSHKTEIAETLLGLAKLSRGVLVQMTIIGGADAGFIATVADWLLDLSVEIRSGEDYQTLWKNRSLDEASQLLIIYKKDMAKDSMQPVGQTFRLPGGYQVVRRADGTAQQSMLSGRVPWEKALEYTFGRDFHNLMAIKEDFGIAIGNAARIYQGLYEGDENIPSQWLANCRSYFPDSHGLAYAHFILMRFPELEPLRDAVFRAARTSSVIQAGVSFDSHMSAIATACGCGTCCSTESGYKHLVGRAFCLTLLAQTIMKTSRALSGMETELCPLRAGLELMFWNTGPSERPATARENMIEEEPKWQSTDGTLMLLKTSDTLFGASRMGTDVKAFEDYICARADHGLCHFLDILINPSFGAGRAAKVHIISGRIEHEGRAYNLLSDVDSISPTLRGPETARPPFLDKYLGEFDKCYGSELTMLVTQRLNGLAVEYAVTKGSKIRQTFGPTRAVHTMCRNEGLVSCGRNSDCLRPPELEIIEKEIVDCCASKKSVCHLKEDENEISLIQGDFITRLTAAAHTWDPIIQRDECLACCVRHGVKIGSKRMTIILDPQYVSSIKSVD